MVQSIVTDSDSEIIFMHPKGSSNFCSNNSFRWPIREDRCLVPFEHILCTMKTPKHALVVSTEFLKKIFQLQINCLKKDFELYKSSTDFAISINSIVRVYYIQFRI